MEKRSWWKKKSSKHSAVSASVNVSANVSPANQSSRRFEDHGMSKFLADQVQEATLRYQEAEEKLRGVNAKLAAAQAEVTEKESLVKQHTKVAEDAVSGWEQAEEETASVKLQLETTTNKLEGKVTQLDSSLKDSLRNLQKAKEEHERKMQELAARKDKEMERVRAELENRLSEVGHRLLESTAESKVLSSTLQERMRTIAELTEVKSKYEAEISVLNVRLEAMDKDNLSLQYEIQVLNKQLQIRNEEKDYCKRETEAVHKQQLESSKRIQLLEAECQRLRTLVKRKLPGPAAVAQMKQEVDAWGRDERRRSLGSSGRNGVEGRLSGGSKDFQVQLLAERVLSMEEETKMLREVLAQKNNELVAARSFASAANSECASVRGGLKPRALALSPAAPGATAGSVSEASVNEDGVSAADAWASNLISDLDSFKKVGGGGGGSPGIFIDDSKFQMMDDFAEMEQLTSVKNEEKPAAAAAAAAKEDSTAKKVDDKDEQLQAANRLCMEISSKLLATEKELAAVQAKNAANEASLIKLQEKLDMLVDGAANLVEGGEELKKQDIQSALSENVHKVICLVEALAHAIGVEHGDDSHSLPSPSTTTASGVSCSSSSSISEHSNSNTSLSFEKLTVTSNQLVQGKVGFSDFMGELSAVLDMMAANCSGVSVRKEVEERMDEEKCKEVKKLSEEVNRLKVEKELLHESCERSSHRLQEVELQLSSAEKLLSELKQHLTESSQYINELEDRIRTADATVGDLREKLSAAEGKYQSERDQHKQLGVRCEELEKQLENSTANRSTTATTQVNKEELSDDRNGEEIAVKLAECQRTILALGKQLKVLSTEPEEKSNSQRGTEQKCLDSERDNELAWSRIKLQGFEPETLACWSPPRSMEPAEEQILGENHQHHHQRQPRFDRTAAAAAAGVGVEEMDSTWLYSPDHRRTVMRSPGRYLNKKTSKNELSKSVNLPVTPKVQASGSFSRFFSRNR